MALSNQAPATRASLLYITGGSVLIIWTVVWMIYLLFNPPESGKIFYAVFGFMATGIVLLAIGVRLGSIGRAAKQAETPPPAAPTASQPMPPTDQAAVVVQSPSDAPTAPVVTVPRAATVPTNAAVVDPPAPVQQR